MRIGIPDRRNSLTIHKMDEPWEGCDYDLYLDGGHQASAFISVDDLRKIRDRINELLAEAEATK